MKNKLVLLFFLGMITIGYSQAKTEFLSIKVQYGIKTTGFVDKVWVDIGKSGQHSLSGTITNEDGVVIIDGRNYESSIDLLNYFGERGWKIYQTRDLKILSEMYYEYFLFKETNE
jgi:hypothetical protein